MSRDLIDVAALRELIHEVVREVLADERRNQPPGEQYMTVADAAKVARVSERTIRRWLDLGKLKRYSAGARLRVRWAELQALLDEDRHGLPPRHRRTNGKYGRELSPEELARRDFAG